MESNFIDHVIFHGTSGAGGPGSVHFRREKFVPKGGPDGGDGGRGGHIILRGNSQLWTLIHLRYRKHIKAKAGGPGEGANKHGADGEDIVLEVPIGTLARESETNELLAEITEDQQEAVIISGGRGGQGNTHFKTSTNQAPRHAQPGEPAVEKTITLELKLLADVGLVGFPNAGKSTLLSSVSAAKPEIGDYLFTTLTPNLGVVPYHDYQSFVIADIPGIIEGAAEGRGLGIRFLRHVERNSILLFVIPVDAQDIRQEYGVLVNELKKYNPELLDKRRLLAISKADLADEELRREMTEDLPEIPYVFISSVTQDGLDALKNLIWEALK